MKNILSQISSLILNKKTTGQKVIEVLDVVVRVSLSVFVGAMEIAAEKNKKVSLTQSIGNKIGAAITFLFRV
ncbi:MAG: hypothetical protein IPN18_12505 [Ignavibacteriales bacterium]|nr:hypothetical protein [Ignavibacteriales bacterium]MBK8662573.1 hypothetical protein [Ignavibacteriales bacterium]